MKKFMIFVTFFFLVISCKSGEINSGTDSGLTTITMNDITKDLNAKMQENTSTKNLTIDFVTLTISPKTNNCSPEKKVPQTTVEKFNNDESNKQFTLKTKNAAKETCLYTLKMQYGAKNTAYFDGETTIGEGKNAYTGKDTKVYISLVFKPTGSKLDMPIAELSGETNVEIIPTINSSTLSVGEMFSTCSKALEHVDIKKQNSVGSGITTTQSTHGTILIKNNGDCIINSKLKQYGFTCTKVTDTSSATYFDQNSIEININSIPNNDLLLLTVVPDPQPQGYKSAYSDTFDLSTTKSIFTSGVVFKPTKTGNQTFSFGKEVPVRFNCTKSN